jgi:lysozyme
MSDVPQSAFVGSSTAAAINAQPRSLPITPEGEAFIRRKEGKRLLAYRDTSGVWTIGIGHTGPEVVAGLTCTEAQCEAWFEKDINIAADALQDELGDAYGSLTENQIAALISFVFNIGGPQFHTSTVRRLIKAGNIEGAARAFALWDKVRGSNGQLVVDSGLLARRNEEAALFLTPDSGGFSPEQSGATAVAPPQSLLSTTTIKGAISSGLGGAATIGVGIAQGAPDIASNLQVVHDSFAGFGIPAHWMLYVIGGLICIGALYAIFGRFKLRNEGRA